jgi:hypothetical protein
LGVVRVCVKGVPLLLLLLLLAARLSGFVGFLFTVRQGTPHFTKFLTDLTKGNTRIFFLDL